PLEPLNPFAACRDQRTSGRKSRDGIKRGKPHHPPEDSSPRNEHGCDRRVRPHPPPRRSGGPPGWSPPGGAAPLFFRAARASRRSLDEAVEGHAAIAAPSIQ